jgi:hypothetical protein
MRAKRPCLVSPEQRFNPRAGSDVGSGRSPDKIGAVPLDKFLASTLQLRGEDLRPRAMRILETPAGMRRPLINAEAVA